MSDQPNEPGSANPPEPVPEVTAARPNTRLGDLAGGHDEDPTVGHPTVFDLEHVSVSYGGKTAIRDVDMDIHCNLVTAFIGPSGCGKTTLLRTLNRLNDLIPGAAVDGKVNGSAWCSSGPTRSPSRSTTTSRTAFGCTA
jgi:ABC-type multidrug transport system fused ATPase/permease subunit